MNRSKLTEQRGQVGIGTLIVFIALVLVAAIAAGVLINTAGFLQTQAEETGTESTDQVADNINIIGEVGTYDNGNSEIDTIRLTVQRSPGSSEIDLTGLSIQYVGDNGFAQLVHGGDVSAGEAGYIVDVVTAESDEDAVITDDGDRYEIVIPLNTDVTNGNVDGVSGGTDASQEDVTNINTLSGGADLPGLSEEQGASLEITTEAGATRNVEIAAPDTFVGLEGGDTVTL